MSVSPSLEAQTSFVPQGVEFKPVGALPGDQVESSVAINRSGGYLLWQDYTADSEGLGVLAQRLDSTLSGAFTPFRVNEQTAGDQEKAQVAMLPDGGAVFVWQSGTRLDSDILARFLAPNGTFRTGELRVNSHTAGVQQDAAVAALGDGSVVVVWSSFDQDGSLQGVYGQLLSATGQKLGGEFRVNQFATYNQRNPAVSALANGNFVVSWVSEQQRAALSVDIYARLFHPATGALGNEFRVNTGSDLAAHPAVSGTEQGGFVVAWTQRNAAVRTDNLDIFLRAYDAAGNAAGNPARLNTGTYGDQFRPRLTTTGAEHLVVWTSLQGAAQEDIFGRFLVGGAPSGADFRVNSRTQSKQVQPAVAADGYGKLYVAWSSFYEGTSFDLVARRYSALRPVPQPAPPLVFALDATRLSVSWPSLSGFDVASYEVYMDDSATPHVVNGNILVATDLAPGSTHSFRLACVLVDGRRSALSEPATGTTWGADLNEDGLPDDWQFALWGKDSGSWPSAGADSDGDGASDYAEFLAGTNPLDAASVLRSELIPLSGQMRFQWNTQPGFVYQVQVSTNLSAWTGHGAPRFAVGATDSILLEPGGAAGYYRVIRVR